MDESKKIQREVIRGRADFHAITEAIWKAFRQLEHELNFTSDFEDQFDSIWSKYKHQAENTFLSEQRRSGQSWHQIEEYINEPYDKKNKEENLFDKKRVE